MLPKKCRLFQKCREGKNTFSRVAGERLENGSHGGRPVRLGLGREVELDSLTWGRRLRNGNSLNMAIEEAGSHQALGFPASTGVGSRMCGSSRCEPGKEACCLTVWRP